jgi:hypothetical protein
LQHMFSKKSLREERSMYPLCLQNTGSKPGYQLLL